jgi:Fe-S-cluster-containing dehydrogenase component
MKKGEYAGVVFYKSNPLYTYPNTTDFNEGLKKVGLKISFSEKYNETSEVCDFSCPDHNYLESWNDAEPKAGHYSLAQPVIAPLFDTRQAQESLLKWAGKPGDFLTYIQEYWKSNFFSRQEKYASYEDFWMQSLQDGVFEMPSAGMKTYKANADLSPAAASLSKSVASDLEIVLYVKTGIGNGDHAGNPWLQELPDPVSKVCWDNYAAVSPQTAEKLGLVQTNVVSIQSNGKTVKLPVLIQPGQANGTVAIALGYGQSIGRDGKVVGVNAYPLISVSNRSLLYTTSSASLSKTTDEDYILASTQTHHTMMGREPVRETTLGEFIKDPKSGNPLDLISTANGKKRPEELDIWATATNPGFEKPNHRWGLGIDLNACIGCGACVVACSAENNVPVVGKDEISRTREMHWIRIDRYYSSAAEETDRIGLESPTADPDKLEVVFQPVMCQHCNHAPCETVCPVAATMHSSEGLNQMAYNRCIGTRYCANNCPYKVRRFNWFKYSDNNKFDYQMNDDLGKMVLNPDVVVRARGVMEKCSMCVQRVQSGKLKAKVEGRRPADGEIQTACAQTCPTHAITFGDYNDKNSEVSTDLKAPRSYYLLYELDTQPSVFYQTKVRNKAKEAKSEA